MSCSICSILWSPWCILVLVAGYVLYRLSMAPYQFFVKKGVPFKKPIPLFGTTGGLTFRKESMYDLQLNSYNEFKGRRFFGMFDFYKPIYVLRDPDLIKQITVKDFEYFLDHGAFLKDNDMEPLLTRSLFFLGGQRWRDMRATLSPAFTGSKMRQMFVLVAECAEQATQILLKEIQTSAEPISYEMKDVFTRFTNDVIATAAFGVKVNSLEDRENEFFMTGKKSTTFSSTSIMLKFMLVQSAPRIAKFFNIRIFDDQQNNFYRDLVHGTIEHREKNGIIRPDMIHLLMQARKGSLKRETASADAAPSDSFATVEEVKSEELRGSEKQVWDDDDLTAQCFLFFLAGFDTTSTLLCFAATELMANPDIQRKLIAEVDEVKEQLNGKTITYEMLQKMTYLDMVISETLRKWPPAFVVDRQCKKTYEMKDEIGRKITVQKGDMVWLPILAIHRDPEFYPEPDRFDPERFSDERKDSIQAASYLPFGSGPRNCIGSRFALMECKAIIYTLLTNFTFEPAANTTIPIKLAKSGFSVAAENGFNMHLKPRF